jgi:hypothetical protein
MLEMNARSRAMLVIAGLVALAGASGGCATMNVKPWDRDLLAKDAMKFAPSPLESAADDHIYFSKEGSTGGASVGGGGCGCN